MWIVKRVTLGPLYSKLLYRIHIGRRGKNEKIIDHFVLIKLYFGEIYDKIFASGRRILDAKVNSDYIYKKSGCL